MCQSVIFGGTFNPLHIGHYEMLKALNRLDDFDEILLMPDKIPPHKVCDYLAHDSHRIEMCRIAAKDFKKANLCLIEFEREGKSYTYDTVMLLKEKFPEKNFSFCCGADMLVTLDTWYNFSKLIEEVSFVVFLREDDVSWQEFSKKIGELRSMGASIRVLDDKIPDVSSTEIRNDFENSQDLLTKEIFDYIKSEGIYGGN